MSTAKKSETPKLRPTKICVTNDDNRFNIVAQTVRIDPRDNSILDVIGQQEIKPNQYWAIDFNAINEAVLILPTKAQE